MFVDKERHSALQGIFLHFVQLEASARWPRVGYAYGLPRKRDENAVKFCALCPAHVVMAFLFFTDGSS